MTDSRESARGRLDVSAHRDDREPDDHGQPGPHEQRHPQHASSASYTPAHAPSAPYADPHAGEPYPDDSSAEEGYADETYDDESYAADPAREGAPLDDEGLFADEHHLEGDDAPDELEDAVWSSRRERAAGRRTSRLRRLRGAVVLLLALAVVAGAGVVAFDKVRPLLTVSSDSGDYPGPGTGTVTVTVADGDTATAIGATLEKAGVVKTARAFAQAAAADPQGTSIQPGKYTLRSQMTAPGALAVLLDPAARSVPRVTIREGLWKSETFAALAKASSLPVSDYVTAAKDATALGLPAVAKGNLEGWLFPATYEFPEGSTAAEQLQTMVAKTTQQLTAIGVAEGDTEKVLTVASIVQAEGQRPQDLPKIARVIDNRLAARMRLQLDSTVSYGVQKRALTTTDAERATTNGYNTYVRDGLPVGPISNPGAAAIKAAQAPATGPWVYFVAVDPQTGETKFATTAAEHAANVAQFQKWCADHPGSC